MNSKWWILILILVCAVCMVVLSYRYGLIDSSTIADVLVKEAAMETIDDIAMLTALGGADVGNSATGGVPSKSEDRVREIFEEIFNAKFPTVNPDWLGGLELDGYNAKLGVGFEFQGPQHTKYSSKYDDDYLGYARRVTDDRYKIAMSEDMGKCLVIVDYVVKDPYQYIISRLYDWCIRHRAQCKRRGWPEWLTTRPRPYIKPIRHRPYVKYRVV